MRDAVLGRSLQDARAWALGRRRALLPSHLLTGLRVHGAGWLAEVGVLNLCFVAAFVVRYGGRVPAEYRGTRTVLAAALITAGYSVVSIALRTYRIVWRFATVRDMVRLGLTVVGCVGLIVAVELGPFRHDRPIPLSTLLIGGALGYLGLSHLKVLPRLRQAVRPSHPGRRLVIYGAGAAGAALARQLLQEGDYRPVAFVDDDRGKVGRIIGGLAVAGTGADLQRVVRRQRVEAVAVAIPSAPARVVRELSRRVLDAGARALVLPSVTELLAGQRLNLRDVDMQDLVGRAEVEVDLDAIGATFTDRCVLITGAAGSIGSELARQVARLRPARLVLLDNNESGLADVRDELEPVWPSEIVVGSITDERFITRTFDGIRPQVVVHAAALKHVDILEEQPLGAVEVNVRGTWLCARAAEAALVERFVFISTDKAADPEGVLGASKRIGELMVTSLRRSGTLFAAVRFGNVLGSRGSVLPKFERQINQGGPVTVTHPDVRRYFMSIAEAVRLVLEAAAVAEPGRIYVLDMGQEMCIADFAHHLVQLRGLRVPEDIRIEFTGLRPGERLQEKLLGVGETALPTVHPKINAVATAGGGDWRHWEEVVAELMLLAAHGRVPEVRGRLLEVARRGSGERRTLQGTRVHTATWSPARAASSPL